MADKQFADFATAASMRDAIQNLAAKVVNSLRPAYGYGTVQSVDVNGTTCTVLPNGPAPNALIYPYYGCFPRVGDKVRIQGLSGDRYVSEVIGPPARRQPLSLLTTAVSVWGSGYSPGVAVQYGPVVMVQAVLGAVPANLSAGTQIAQIPDGIDLPSTRVIASGTVNNQFGRFDIDAGGAIYIETNATVGQIISFNIVYSVGT